MSIKAYVGRMGSGKTYEVVSEVILNALRRGCRVISNVAGLNYDEFYTLLIEEGVPADNIGKIVMVSHDDVLKAAFWRTDKDPIPDPWDDTVKAILPGDVVALDENWRFWEGFAARNMPEEVMNFFRMHRHMTHPISGVSCNVALISQDVMDFARRVRAVIEETYYMEKLTAVGSTKRYRVDVHQGGKTVKKPIMQYQRSYNPMYFPLYSSHSMKQEGDAEAKEENIDGRGNILHGALFKVGLPLAAIMMLISAYGMYHFFNKGEAEEVAADPSAPAAQVAQAQPDPTRPEVTEDWKTTGFYQRDDSLSVIIQGPSGNIRVLQDPPTYKITPIGIEVELPEGGFATPWTNITKTQGGIL